MTNVPVRTLLLLLAHGLALQATGMDVQDGDITWTVIGIEEYYVHNGTDKQDYRGAEKRCKDLDAHLVIVQTDDAQSIVARLIKHSVREETGRPYRSFYIGLRDYTGNNANYMWTNGELLHFIDGTPMQWADGEPNNFNRADEDCVTMGSAAVIADYRWFDVPCSSKRSYVCQKYTADAIHTADPTTYVFNSGMVLFVFALMFSTGLYHRRKIFKVKLVPALTPPGSPLDARVVKHEMIKLDPEDISKEEDELCSSSTTRV